MFFVELKEQEDVPDEDEDEIDKSIQEIHQSAQNLSDNISQLGAVGSTSKLVKMEDLSINGSLPIFHGKWIGVKNVMD